jgi:hypothetical protein
MQKVTRQTKKRTASKTITLANGKKVSTRSLKTVRGAAKAIVGSHKAAFLELGDR